jgi:hypothetical protein
MSSTVTDAHDIMLATVIGPLIGTIQLSLPRRLDPSNVDGRGRVTISFYSPGTDRDIRLWS